MLANLRPYRLRGATLIELMVFIVVVSIAMGGLWGAFNQGISQSVDPIVRVRILELAQSKLDEVMSRKYDHATPSGGIPTCGSAAGPACIGIGRESLAETCATPSTLNDVDDFSGCDQDNSPNPYAGYTFSIAVTLAGDDLGLADNSNGKRIQVNVAAPNGEQVTLSAYRANF